MPDLNLDNKNVIEELKNIQYFWTKKGVDGFRYDAIVEYFSSKGETQNNYNVPKIMKILREASNKAINDANRNIENVFMMGE
jgi:alpha-amylase